MKKLISFIFLLPALMFGAAGDIKIDRKNSSDNAWISTIFAKQNSALLMTDSSGVPTIATDIPTAITIGSAYIYRVGGADVAVADGGTGLSSGTSGGVLYYSAPGTLASSGLLASGGVLIGGGAGATPFTDADMTFVTDTLTVTKGNIGGITLISNALGSVSGISGLANSDLTITAGAGASSFNVILNPTRTGIVIINGESSNRDAVLKLNVPTLATGNPKIDLFATGVGEWQMGMITSTGAFGIDSGGGAQTGNILLLTTTLATFSKNVSSTGFLNSTGTSANSGNGMVQRFRNGYATAGQTPAATTRTYITGSDIGPFTAAQLQVGTIIHWHLDITKTAAGVASATFDIAFGTAGSTSDTARVSFTKPAGVGNVDHCGVDIYATVKTNSASGVVIGDFILADDQTGAGGFLASGKYISSSTVTSGTFDTTTPTHVGLCVTTGASDAWTINHVQTWTANL